MGGNFLDSAQVRKLEKLPTKKELITAIAVMVKKVRFCFGNGCLRIILHKILAVTPASWWERPRCVIFTMAGRIKMSAHAFYAPRACRSY